MQIIQNQVGIVTVSQRYDYQPFLMNWIFNNGVINIPVFDIYHHQQSSRVVTGDWILHFDQTIEQTNMIIQTILGRTAIQEGLNDLLDSLPRIVDDYMMSLPENLNHRGIGLNFSFGIGDRNVPMELKHVFSSSPHKFEQLFGDQYEMAARILWKHADFDVEFAAMPVNNNVDIQAEVFLNYDRDIESVDEIKATLPNFMSVNENASMVVQELMGKTDG